jgi:hypothetical protein
VPDSNAELRDRLLLRPVVPIQIPTTAVSVAVVGKACLLVGWSFEETTGGATAALEVRAGDSTSGAFVAGVALASGGASTDATCNEGILCESGVGVTRLSGSFKGAVWVRI